MDVSSEDRRALGQVALEIALACHAAADRPIFPRESDRARLRALEEPLPMSGAPGLSVLEQYRTLIEPNCRNNAHPLMAGYVVSAGTWMGVLGDFLASTTNQNVTSWRSSPGPCVVEQVVVRWIAEMLGYGASATGLLLSGGSMANFSALAAALKRQAKVDITRQGVRALERPPVFYGSALVHLSVAKALSMLGVGSDALSVVAHDAAGRLRADALSGAIAEDRRSGRLPVCVIANAGDVNTGAVDDLTALGELCLREQLWLHVDAAYGGFAALAPSAKALFSGMASADSVSVDAHKWLSVPMDAGCLLVKDGATLRAAFSHDADYIQVLEGAPLESFAFWDYGPELSRRFRALKIWFTLKTYGAEAIGNAIEENILAARALGDALDATPDFELLAPVGLSIVCFRYVPPELRARLAHASPEIAKAARAEADDLNRRVLLHLQRSGRVYLSNTMIAGQFALRACIVNHRTKAEHVFALLDIIRQSADAVTRRG